MHGWNAASGAVLAVETIPLAQARPGRPLGRGVRTASGCAALGTPLRRELIDELDRHGVRSVDVLVGKESWDSPAHAARAELLATVLESHVRTSPPASRAQRVPSGQRAAWALAAAISTAAWLDAVAEPLVEHGLRPDFLATGLEVALLSAVVGAHLEWPDEQLADVALGALLADIGMALVPGQAWRRPGGLSGPERRKLRAHPILGARLLGALDEVAPTTVQIVREHHERVDGTGYPERLHGAQVAQEVQVVAVCQRYLAAVTERAYRPAVPPHEAVELLMTLSGRLAEAGIIQAFQDSVAIYPEGALVRLSDGTCGSVISGGMPLRPRVRIMWDRDGERVPAHVVDLVEERSVFVTAVASGTLARVGPSL